MTEDGECGRCPWMSSQERRFLFSLFLFLFWNWSSESDGVGGSICSDTQNLKKKQREEGLQLAGMEGEGKSGEVKAWVWRTVYFWELKPGDGETGYLYIHLNSQPKWHRPESGLFHGLNINLAPHRSETGIEVEGGLHSPPPNSWVWRGMNWATWGIIACLWILFFLY